MGRRKRWSEARRREILAAHERSGLSLKAFADRRGLPYSTLVSWRKRAATAEPARLVPVEVAGAEVPALEVRVGSATVVVGRGFDEGHLVRVVRALRSC